MEPSGFREIARSAKVTYPIPFVFALSLAFSVLVLGGAIVAHDLLRWFLVGFGGLSIAFAFLTFALAAIWRPQLLRSEQHDIRSRVIGFVEDSDFAPEAVEVARLALDQPTKKMSARRGGPQGKANEQ